MAVQYYYPVAGLPSLVLDDNRPLLPLAEAYDAVEKNVTPADAEAVRFIRSESESPDFFEKAVNHAHPFIREWYGFERKRRNLIAGINCRRFGRSPDEAVAGSDEFSENIRKSRAPDFGVTAEWPWASRFLALDWTRPAEAEKAMDLLRWEKLDELTASDRFAAGTLFAFLIKLAMCERWKKLNPQTGRELFGRLTSGVRAGYQDKL